MKKVHSLRRKIGLVAGIGVLLLAAAFLLLRTPLETAVKAPVLAVETPQKLQQEETVTLDVTISELGDALYPAASLSICFDPSKLEFLGIEEGNVFVRNSTVGRQLPEWSCSPVQSNKTGVINIMYLDLTGGKHAFDRALLEDEDNVLMRLSFRLRGSARAGDVYDLEVEDAVFAASDEHESLAMTRNTLRVKNGRIVVGG